MGRGVLQGIYAYDLCICVQSESINVACPEEFSFGFMSKCILCPILCPCLDSPTYLAHSPGFQTAFTESTQPGLPNLVSFGKPPPLAYNSTFLLFSGQSPWPRGSSLRCCQYFILLCASHWIPFLAYLTSTHQALPFPRVTVLTGRLVP